MWLDVFVGCYSSPHERGVHWLKMHSKTGELVYVDGLTGIENPSFLALHQAGVRLYAVGESKNGEVVSIEVDREACSLRLLNRASTRGADPCHVRLTSDAKVLIVTNYSSGSVCTFRLDPDGRIGQMAAHVVHQGHSVRPDRQQGPHPHSAMPESDSSWVLVPDLGLDQVLIYRLDKTTGQIRRHASVATPAGSGPRHLAFHPRLALVYVCCELDSTIVSYRFDRADGRMTEWECVSLLPAGFTGLNTAADIHVRLDGRFLYASNRGHDTVACFAIGEDGRLTGLGHVSAGGRTPRNFALTPDGRHMLVASQDDDQLSVFALDEAGWPRPTGSTYAMSRPVCIQVQDQKGPLQEWISQESSVEKGGYGEPHHWPQYI